MEILFFALLFLTLYSFVVYPVLLLAVSAFVNKGWRKGETDLSVTLIVSAHNEEEVIGQKVQNCLGLASPPKGFDVVVVSDGSTDETDEIVSRVRDCRVSLAAFPRLGKTECLNRVVPLARGEIVVFTDANSLFPSGALMTALKSFKDLSVGAVTGWTTYIDAANGTPATGVYSRFERWMKHRESLVASCAGADGAIFAIRKELFRPLKADDINDLVIPLNVLKAGKRVVMDQDLFCCEQAAEGASGEYRRQVRITARTLTALGRNMECMNPFRFGFFSFFLISHKALRLMFPFFMLGAGAVCVASRRGSALFEVFLYGGATAVAVALYGLIRKPQNRVVGVISAFFLTAFAHLAGWMRMARGASDVVWLPRH